ncbi:uncharacterized protein LOC135268132 [Aotus nancymaae]|uniref:uncharacterized protein LOC135268132 n=1 Tax=Aotus nancymaae TaxID=37293 RepID=UPI0030FE8BC2
MIEIFNKGTLKARLARYKRESGRGRERKGKRTNGRKPWSQPASSHPGPCGPARGLVRRRVGPAPLYRSSLPQPARSNLRSSTRKLQSRGSSWGPSFAHSLRGEVPRAEAERFWKRAEGRLVSFLGDFLPARLRCRGYRTVVPASQPVDTAVGAEETGPAAGHISCFILKA